MSVPALTKIRVTLNGLEAWDPAGFISWDFSSAPGGFGSGDWKLRIFNGGSPIVAAQADATVFEVVIPLRITGGPSAGSTTLTTLATTGRFVDFPNKGGTVALLDDIPADSGWIAPTLVNSWLNYSAAYESAGYRKERNRVQLRGCLRSGTIVDGTILFTLPAGYRPPAGQVAFLLGVGGPASGAGTFNIQIASNGVVAVYNLSGNSFITLNGASFYIN